jgi:hypothetical protein
MKWNLFWRTVPVVWLAAALSLAQTIRDTRISIYQGNLAFVQEGLQFQLKSDKQQLVFEDLPESMVPASFRFFPENPEEFQVVELFSIPAEHGMENLLRKNVGKPVVFILEGGIKSEGVLLRGGDPYWIRTGDGNVRLLPSRKVVWMEFTEGHPPAGKKWAVRLKSRRKGKMTAVREYFTRGVMWEALYWVHLFDEKLSIEGWAQLENRSGKDFERAAIQLIAGSVNLSGVERDRGRFARAAVPMALEEISVEPLKVSEYYRFKLPARYSLRNGEIRKIWLFSAKGIRYRKAYVHDARFWPKEVRTEISFLNDSKNRLGQPLAAGRVFLFRKDDRFTTLVGTDHLKDTPEGQKVRLQLGTVFDLTVERKQTRSMAKGKKRHVESFEITFRNAKERPVEIISREYFYFHAPDSRWRIVETSAKYRREAARVAAFTVDVPARSSRVLRYTVEYSW